MFVKLTFRATVCGNLLSVAVEVGGRIANRSGTLTIDGESLLFFDSINVEMNYVTVSRCE